MCASTKRHNIPADLDDLPNKPGVYLFYDKYGDVIYIGKSVKLRQRVLSYFRDGTPLDNRIGEMVFNVRDVTFRVTRTELLALLLEDELIKQHLPRYNTRQKEFLDYRYLTLSQDVYPTLKMVDHSGAVGVGKIFGPFRDKYFTNDVVTLVRRHLHLRSCKEQTPTQKSVNYDLGFCAGPCRGKITPEDYAAIVRKTVDFMNGDDTVVVARANEAMEEAARARDYEKAEQLKQKIEFCRRFCDRQRFVQKFKTQNLTIVHDDQHTTAYRFIKGILSAPKTARNKNHEHDPRFVLDRANIVYGWLKKQRSGCRYFFES